VAGDSDDRRTRTKDLLEVGSRGEADRHDRELSNPRSGQLLDGPLFAELPEGQPAHLFGECEDLFGAGGRVAQGHAHAYFL
jgi:hypothetical protein